MGDTKEAKAHLQMSCGGWSYLWPRGPVASSKILARGSEHRPLSARPFPGCLLLLSPISALGGLVTASDCFVHLSDVLIFLLQGTALVSVMAPFLPPVVPVSPAPTHVTQAGPVRAICAAPLRDAEKKSSMCVDLRPGLPEVVLVYRVE